MLPAKKVFCTKMFRDPKNGGSDQVKTDLQPTGVPKKLNFSKFDKILKCDFWAEGVLPAKKIIYEKMFRDPENGGSDRVKTDLRPTGVPKNSFV